LHATGDGGETRRIHPSGTIGTTYLRALLDAASRHGVDAERVRRDLDVSEETLRDPSASVALEIMTRAWIAIPALANDPDFGIVAAETMAPGSYGALEYAVLSSATATEALARAVRFQKVTYAMSDLSFAVEGPSATIRSRSFGLASDDDLRHYIEHGFAFVATRVRALLAPGPLPLRVAFPHPPPQDTTAHHRVFGANVRFAQPRAELVFASADLGGALASHDPAFLETFADEEQKLSLVAAHAATSTKERVRHLLLARMRQGDASVASIARILRLSTRTLQRNLREEKAPFSALVDEVRAEEARRYVIEGKLSFGEMAFRLGFSQQSAFFRAFKRWTGTTPSDLRAVTAARSSTRESC
jgi:AraC-like DNA-binding protein